MKGRVSFKSGAVQHIYQRTNNGYLIFYSVKDYLVFFTIIMTVAKQHNVKILGLCFMVDHIHLLVKVESRESLSAFVHHYTVWFSQEWNKYHGLSGSLFARQFGFASKDNNKSIRSAIAYLFNNPVEKKLCSRPELARWNFLLYGIRRYPFSEPVRKDRARTAFRRALSMVDAVYRTGRPIGYTLMNRMASDLTRIEQQQLADYIILVYNGIDYLSTISYYGSYEKLVSAVNTAKGSEYDIQEAYSSGSDQIYIAMTRHLLSSGEISDIDSLFRLTEAKRIDLSYTLSLETGASMSKVAKYLHLKNV